MSKFTLAQQLAIDARKGNYVVSAGAGSGKTTVLTERVLKLLESGVRIDHMLILTFTVNAAFNMKNKIKAKIMENSNLLDQLKYVDGADISTFDSFNQKIVRKYKDRLGIDDEFQIADGSYMQTMKIKLMEKVFDDHYESDDKTFMELLDKYTFKDDYVLKSLVLSISNMIATTSDPLLTLEESMKAATDIKIVHDAYESIYHDIKKTLGEFKKGLSEFKTDTKHGEEYKGDLITIIEGLESAPSFDEFKSMYSLIKYPRRGAKTSENEKNYLGPLKDHYKKELDSYLSLPRLDYYLEQYVKSSESKVVILTLAREHYEALQDYKRLYSCYEFNDIALMALKLLRENEDIREEVASSYDYIMVDEYQDNSDIQEAMIDLLERDNLFMVGDVKQSIYRFRNANPNLFMKRYEDYKAGRGGTAIDMNENFRSSNAVISDVNDLFAKVMSLDLGGADYLASHQIISANPIYKSMSLHNHMIHYEGAKAKERPEIEAHAIASDIAKRIEEGEEIEGRKVTYSDFAIILDRGTDFDTFIDVMNLYGIPLFVDNDKNARDLVVIDLVKNLYMLYNSIYNEEFQSNNFRRSLVSVSRASLNRVSDSVIYEALKNETYGDLPAYNKMVEIIESEDKKETIEDLFYLFVKAYNLPLFLATLGESKDNLAILETHAAIVMNLSRLGLGVNELLEYYQAVDEQDLKIKVKINTDVKNAVTLTNIHKSKGLEYNFCYFGGFYKKYNEQDLKSPFIYSIKHGVILPMVVMEDVNFTDPLAHLYKKEELLADHSEKIRLLYVALTRAKYAYTFVCCDSFTKSVYNYADANSFQALLNTIDYTIYNSSFYEGPDSEHSRKLTKEPYVDYGLYLATPKVLTPQTDKTIRERASNVTTHASKETLDYGTYMHKLCETIDYSSPDYSLAPDNKTKYLLQTLVSNMESLGIRNSTVYHEYQYYDKDSEEMGIIDLLLIFKTHAIIVDYKLKNIDDEGYISQLNTYAKAIKREFGLDAKAYLYSLLEGKLSEVEIKEEIKQ